MDSRLQEIIAHGSPAQARLAQQLTSGDEDAVVALFDAYLNDPYLTRY